MACFIDFSAFLAADAALWSLFPEPEPEPESELDPQLLHPQLGAAGAAGAGGAGA